MRVGVGVRVCVCVCGRNISNVKSSKYSVYSILKTGVRICGWMCGMKAVWRSGGGTHVGHAERAVRATTTNAILRACVLAWRIRAAV